MIASMVVYTLLQIAVCYHNSTEIPQSLALHSHSPWEQWGVELCSPLYKI